MKHQGGCRCGQARYEVNLDNAFTIVCHCVDCQKHLGAPYSVFSIVPTGQFVWIKAPTGRISFGPEAERLFCKNCGTYLKWEGKASGGEAEFNAMTLDTPNIVTVDVEIFVRSRSSWLEPLAGVPQYEAGRHGNQPLT